jgi:hypothetical protein
VTGQDDDWGEGDDELQESWQATVEPAGPGESDDPEVADPLATLRGAPRLQIWRSKPTWCKGMLCTIDVADDEEIDLGQLKEDWGGGTMMLRPMEYKHGQGWHYVKGAVSVTMTGEPLEAGNPIGSRRGQRVVDTTAREPMGSTPVRSTGGGQRGMELMSGLFDRITDRLDRLEQRLATPVAVTPPDPLGEVKRAAAMVHELRGIAGIFAGTDVPDDDDDDDDDEEEPERPKTPEEMLMHLAEGYLEKKAEEGDAPQAAPAAPKPRLIHRAKQVPSPSQPAPQPAVATLAAEPEEFPEPEPEPEPEPVVVHPEPDPWGRTVPAEMRGNTAVATAPALDPAGIADMLRGLPPEQAMDLLNGAIKSLPKEQVIQWVQQLQSQG